MAHDQLNVYSQNQKVNLGAEDNSRATDSLALLTCARKLEDAKQRLATDPKSKDLLMAYGDAIRFNQRLWTIFQVALTDPANPLSTDLKIILMNLSRYVDKTSLRAVGKYSPELIDSLISINCKIAAGLGKQQPAQQQPVQQSTVPTYQDAPRSITTSA